MCVQNRMLTAMYNQRIELYIKTEKDIQKLKDLAEVAPYEIVMKIIHNMRGDKEKFSKELIKKHEVSHDTKVLLEKYTEKEAA